MVISIFLWDVHFGAWDSPLRIPWVLIRPIGRRVSFRALARRLAAGIPINADDAWQCGCQLGREEVEICRNA